MVVRWTLKHEKLPVHPRSAEYVPREKANPYR
jgi:hypothetical protein